MAWYARATVIITGLIVMGCTQLATSAAKECRFSYDNHIMDGTVIPVLKNKYGSRFSLFNIKDPAIFNQNGVIRLVFGQSKPGEGYMPVDTANFVIEIDPCTLKVISAFETSSSPEGVPPSVEPGRSG